MLLTLPLVTQIWSSTEQVIVKFDDNAEDDHDVGDNAEEDHDVGDKAEEDEDVHDDDGQGYLEN